MIRAAVFLLFAGMVLTACAGRPAVSTPAGDALTAVDHFITVDGVRLHYQRFDADGPDLVLIHGFGSSTYTWHDIAPGLQKAGYRVWAVDMKGFGWSDKPVGADYAPKRLAMEVADWMGAVGLSHATLIGNSLGGAICLMIAIDHPDRVDRLVLIDSAGYPLDPPFVIKAAQLPGAAFLARLLFGKWMIRANMKQAFYRRDRITPQRVQAYYDRTRTPGALEAQVAVARAAHASDASDYVKRIPSIFVPTLILWGEKDPWIPLSNAKHFKKDLPQAELVVIPDCGHVPEEEAPAETLRHLLDFLGR